MTAKHSQVRLTKRDHDILLQAKTDIVIPEIVYRRFFFNGTMEGARSVIRRLCGEPPDYLYLQPEPLDDKRVYYRLTLKGARLLGISPKYAVALKKQGKITRYALAWFFHADEPHKHTRFNPHQFPDRFPLAGHSLPRHPFFVEETADRIRLGIALVDHNAHLRRVVHKTLKPLGRFLRHGWFDDYIRAESFVVAILTFSERRKKSLETMLQQAIVRHFRTALFRLRPDLKDRLPIDIRVHVIPGMDILVTSRTPQEKK
jgi:hypothetical protein